MKPLNMSNCETEKKTHQVWIIVYVSTAFSIVVIFLYINIYINISNVCFLMLEVFSPVRICIALLNVLIIIVLCERAPTSLPSPS